MCSIVSLLYCLLILLSINITVVTSAEANKTEIDRQALLCFKSGISSDPLGVLNSWRNTSRNFCNWSAVTCDVRHPIRVVSIDLTSMHLTGQISGCIANLTSLSQIHLADNSLSGAIPDELGMLPGLQTLMLAGNHLEGNHEFKALIFKFMVNGSLETWLHSEHYSGLPERVLSLGQRIHIAADVASALDYVHNQVSPPLVHCDLKPSNILLDKDMTARLSDFGSAKFLFPGLSVPKSLAEVGGTIGYMAPEYAMGSEIATEGDVYSFGVLLLEIVTGKHPTDDLFVDGLNLHNFAESMFPDRLAEIIDPHMAHEESQPCTEVWMQSCIVPLVALGLSCSMESPKDRPRMQDVCAKLFAIEDDFQKSHGQLLNSPCP
ncbi:putative receptor-like protein kinase At3g47110 isoform X3 [Sorghum bicolor]|uniref:putative receptor-like protein kinase At3g47110 isoform X3 n=1 Tax=Sorghum bicolor TaxID=4558 RepID=UPI000B424429|nr:putative receptor-like protein kinase At3g47110 isoform X3 [Sorghum bicolor]|eukprot:XP_021319816.1 putative receptor-like protein kinase At3g47110 isoform X3 [Sorghum bicolor]